MKATDPLIRMTASEVAFLRAEGAAVHHFSMGGTAEEFYNRGIRLSFEQWGVAGAEDYIADASSMPQAYHDPSDKNPYNDTLSDITIKWDESADAQTKLERIITRNGSPSTSTATRPGPNTAAPVSRSSSPWPTTVRAASWTPTPSPQRMPYPQEEYTNNSANVTAAVNNVLGGPDKRGHESMVGALLTFNHRLK